MTKGKCFYCSGEFKDSVMGAHLQSCSFRPKSANNEKKDYGFLIKATGKYRKGYWLFIEVKDFSTLEDLDSFLRDIWLECCGHLSCFKINGVQFYNNKETVHELGGTTMNVSLKKVLKAGTAFQHEYDFGSTTQLTLQVMANLYTLQGSKSPVRLAARNNPPKLRCASCGKASKYICDDCVMNGEKGYYCEPCLEKHPCGGNMALSISNSPRMGVCDYSGPDDEK
ncbi:MAG: hypothetical protein HY513_03005 [Candidatus Aenigmarchaeota archaeon]|nr:hypothetical protein [Candidatus Aenigmarchaeota archaeon]